MEAASPILFTVDEVLEVEEVSNILVTPTFNTVAPRDSIVPIAASKLFLKQNYYGYGKLFELVNFGSLSFFGGITPPRQPGLVMVVIAVIMIHPLEVPPPPLLVVYSFTW